MLRMGRTNNNKVANTTIYTFEFTYWFIDVMQTIGSSMSCKEFDLRSLPDTKQNITQSLFHDALVSYKDIPNEFANYNRSRACVLSQIVTAQ